MKRDEHEEVALIHKAALELLVIAARVALPFFEEKQRQLAEAGVTTADGAAGLRKAIELAEAAVEGGTRGGTVA